MRATTFVWEAVGRPAPIETDGSQIVSRGTPGVCAHCGAADASYRLDQAISDSFTTVRNASILWPHGGDRLCAGCTWSFKSIFARCGLMFARLADHHGPSGVWWLPLRPLPRPDHVPKTAPWPARPDALSILLDPPPTPFVAWCPLYGIDHGGEAHVHRTFGPDGRGGVHHPADPLRKLQSKHCLPFANIATDRRHYEIAIDDWPIVVDVELWSRTRLTCESLLVDLRGGGVGAEDARAALKSLEVPRGAPLSLAAPHTWRERVTPLRPHAGARWWEFFLGLLRMPALNGGK